ncbi:tRNA pseudouridine synthase B [Breoghania corrubedonensis]|uniref:tRNA pseudouridine synthase B n=1 Tax=Breoghania corrubedonensis TaxID=665038 RepID=A0A2T5VGX2_9HYPH|nr:tRNA pseudouridine(55) synthase TruB [Breoghania corrubedonensis]PTW63003.1 tRNA pseudouridine synthase B [Breoghania corrubedonensis]
MKRQQTKHPKFDIDGWLVLDKPVGLTSNDALSRLKRLFHPKKVGHAGTLDPAASGCLPIAFGEATKTVPYVMDGRKVYRFAVRWGEETNTDDTEGEVIETSPVRPSGDEIREILPEFTGTIEQVPPKFSAIKIAGERAYDLAREGQDVEMKSREIEVHRLDLADQPDDDTAIFETECGKGTYVRALARDMGRRLGTRGHVVELRRLLVGPFGEDDMVTLEELAEAVQEAETPVEAAQAELMPVETALEEALMEVPVNRNDEARLRRGQSVIVRGRDAPVLGGEVYVTCQGRLVAICTAARGELQPRRVFSIGATES